LAVPLLFAIATAVADGIGTIITAIAAGGNRRPLTAMRRTRLVRVVPADDPILPAAFHLAALAAR